MNLDQQERQLFSKEMDELQVRRKAADRNQYGPLIEKANELLQKCLADEVEMDRGDASLSELYYLTAELLFASDLAARAVTHVRSLGHETEIEEYYNKAIELQDKEEYSYALWNFLSTADRREEGIAALERFIQRTGGTAKVLARAAEYILMYADSEDSITIQRSLDYFYQAIEKEPDRYETYWSFWTDLEEAVDVCPRLFKESVLCLEKLIELSLPEDSENHDTLGNRYLDLAVTYNKMKEYEKAYEAAKKGLAVCGDSDYGIKLMMDILNNRISALSNNPDHDKIRAGLYFELAHCYHITNQPELAGKYYLAMDKARDLVPPQYKDEFILYYKAADQSLWGKIKRWLRALLKMR